MQHKKYVVFFLSFYRRKSPPQAKFLGVYGGSVRIFWFPRGRGQLGKIYPKGWVSLDFFILGVGGKGPKKMS